jgi:hypothetical protein
MFAQATKAYLRSSGPFGLLASEKRRIKRILSGAEVMDSIKESLSVRHVIKAALVPVLADLPAEGVGYRERVKTYSTIEATKFLRRTESVIRRECSKAWNKHNGPGPLKYDQSWWVVEPPSPEGGRSCGWRLEKRN